MRRIIFTIIIFILGLAILGGIIWGVSLLPVFHQSKSTTTSVTTPDDTVAPDTSTTTPSDQTPAPTTTTPNSDTSTSTSPASDSAATSSSNLPSTGPDTISGTIGAVALAIAAFLAVSLVRSRKLLR